MTDNKGDLISREALKKKLEEMANNEWNITVGSSKGLNDAIDVVDNAPTVDPEIPPELLAQVIEIIREILPQIIEISKEEIKKGAQQNG